ncbi:transcription termination factor NusA [Spiroplasma eriocheiris]|uniref:Transcription termination/antitermination protein NusA n=1 Tax=Spiroplasma eriocheiris TaxID=315358 RepID=A0A0H3XLW7_9MOLU|nr:transcription termination factor NusA [Spiroplasma eriocheiris]AHF58137.1 putative transcription termination factor [Spiroplasma eriocheiris CCTCC M 207170]AKM54574.1 transcription elongation factor NusA [Spiroplasma eriocheiris]
MIDRAKLLSTIDEIVKEKQINRTIILESIKEGIKKAYEKHFDPEATIIVNIDNQTGQITVQKELKVVKKVEDDLLEIGLNEAKKEYGENVTIGDTVYEPINSEEFSRLAIIQVGQIIKQQIKEAEKDSIFDEYINEKGNLMSGVVIAAEERYLLIEVDRTFAYMPRKNLIFSDHYDVGDQILFLAEDVNKSKNAGQITASRTSNDFLAKLMEREVPEIFEKVIEIKAIARDPGRRSKIAVFSHNENIDPIGACVGTKGSRINKVTEELNDEKIDICIYSPNNKEFIINSLSPVKVISIVTNDKNKEADVVVPDEQLSLAIGKGGSAAKLVAKLTKWKLNIINYSEALANKTNILWNGNINEEELAELKIKLKDKVKEKQTKFEEKQRVAPPELPEVETFEIIEEHLVEDNNGYLDNEENYHVESLVEENDVDIQQELQKEIATIEDTLSFFEENNPDKDDEEINYDEYDDYYADK